MKSLAGGTKNNLGKGGMATKVTAACIAGKSGIDTIILNGAKPQNLYTAISGGDIGTKFSLGGKA